MGNKCIYSTQLNFVFRVVNIHSASHIRSGNLWSTYPSYSLFVSMKGIFEIFFFFYP